MHCERPCGCLKKIVEVAQLCHMHGSHACRPINAFSPVCCWRNLVQACTVSRFVETLQERGTDKVVSYSLTLILQVAEAKRELQASQAKVEQQERELGGAQQRLQMLEEEVSRLQQESAALSQQKAEVDHLQGIHAEHAHIFRWASLTDLSHTQQVFTGFRDTPSTSYLHVEQFQEPAVPS